MNCEKCQAPMRLMMEPTIIGGQRCCVACWREHEDRKKAMADLSYQPPSSGVVEENPAPAIYKEKYKDPAPAIYGADPVVLPGVGPDAPTVFNEAGGGQSSTPYRCDLLPPKALLATAKVLEEGARKYAPNNWRRIPREDHLNHLLVHVLAFLAGDQSDEHLAHAACRILFAMETE